MAKKKSRNAGLTTAPTLPSLIRGGRATLPVEITCSQRFCSSSADAPVAGDCDGGADDGGRRSAFDGRCCDAIWPAGPLRRNITKQMLKLCQSASFGHREAENRRLFCW